MKTKMKTKPLRFGSKGEDYTFEVTKEVPKKKVRRKITSKEKT